MAILVTPSEYYRESYLRALKDFQAEGRRLEYDWNTVAKDFPGFVRGLHDQANPQKVRPGFVPATQFWLIDADEFIGHVSIRHQLNDWLSTYGGHIGYEIAPRRRRQGYGVLILRLALPQARMLGLPHVLVTCDSDNIGSQKIIERNGGRFENALPMPGGTIEKRRYWIDVV